MHRKFARRLMGLVLAAALALPGTARAKDILETATDAGTFTILLAAVKAQLETYVTRKAQADLVTKLRDSAKIERLDKKDDAKPADAKPDAKPADKK